MPPSKIAFAACFLISLAGLILIRILRRTRPYAPLTAILGRLEIVFAAGFIVCFVLAFTLGMASSFRSLWERR